MPVMHLGIERERRCLVMSPQCLFPGHKRAGELGTAGYFGEILELGTAGYWEI